jgi:FdhD protein
MKESTEWEVVYWKPEKREPLSLNVVGEALLSIRIQGKTFSSGMRTPGEETAQAAGFCLTEGLVESPEDLESVAYTESGDPNTADVVLSPSRWALVSGRFDEHRAQTPPGFGQSPEESVENAARQISPLPIGTPILLSKGLALADGLNRLQPLRRITHATHASAIYNRDYELLSAAEDVGRHNGMDKAIGRLLLERRLSQAALFVLSSRVSFELVQKAARARIPVIFSVSRPTALAIRLAVRLDMTLACLARGGGGYVFCGNHRLEMA